MIQRAAAAFDGDEDDDDGGGGGSVCVVPVQVFCPTNNLKPQAVQ